MIRFYSLVLVTSFSFAQTPTERITEYFYAGYQIMYTQKDSANYHFDQAISLSAKQEDYGTCLQILEYALFSNGYHFDLNAFRTNLERSEVYIQKLSDSIDASGYTDALNLNWGNYYYKLRDFEKALPYFQKLSEQYDDQQLTSLSKEDHNAYQSTLLFLASLYKNTGKFELSRSYYDKARSQIEQTTSETEKLANLRNIDRLVSQLYSEQKEFSKANPLLYRLLNYYQEQASTNPEAKNTLLSTYHRLVENLIAQDSTQKATKLLEDSQPLLLENDPFLRKATLLYGNAYAKQKQHQKAQQQYEKALELYKTYRNGSRHQDIALVYQLLAKNTLSQNQVKKALGYLEKAIENTHLDKEASADNSFPDPVEVFSKRQLLELYSLQLDALEEGLLQNDAGNYLEQGLTLIPEILELFDLLKREFESKLDKRFIVESATPLLHKSLDFVYTGYSQRPSNQLLNLALEITETGKDIFLQEAIRSSRAVDFLNIPESIRTRESTFKTQIGLLEKELFNSSESKTQNHLYDSLFGLKNNYYQFLDSLRVAKPRYHDLKYQRALNDIQEVQKELNAFQTGIISLTLTRTAIFSLSISADQVYFHKQPLSEENREQLKSFYQLLRSPQWNKGTDEFAELAGQLYELILAPSVDTLAAVDELVVIPDGLLYYLPFDILYKDDQYLLYSKAISYSDAIASWLQLQEGSIEEKSSLAAFAPSFEGKEKRERFQFGQLIYNQQEVEQIGPLFESQLFKGEEGSLSNFLNVKDQVSLLHLATHASANDEFPDYSYLAFTPKADSLSTLYVKDLYAMNIPAEMVVLSACQTGIGKLERGEGMLSLSKGFQYAGARSLVNSLWKINDKSTTTLMTLFYENLKGGMSKSKAMQQAKIDYLNLQEDDLLKHPYYWAAFSISGNTRQITQQTPWYLWAGGTLALFGIGFYLVRRKV